MSALAWDPTDVGLSGPHPARGRHLVVVSSQARNASDAGGLRLTRRGRLALFLLVLTVAAFMGLTGLRGADAAEPLRSVTVVPGQTLSQIALAELPRMSLNEGIVAIQIANQLSTAQVSAGQLLVIPSA